MHTRVMPSSAWGTRALQRAGRLRRHARLHVPHLGSNLKFETGIVNEQHDGEGP